MTRPLASCAFLACTVCTAQSATLQALAPLTATALQGVTSTGQAWPAGPLTSDGVVHGQGATALAWTVPNGLTLATVSATLSVPPDPVPVLHTTAGDFLLEVNAPAGTTGHLLLRVTGNGEWIQPWAMRVDVGNDGTDELDAYAPWLWYERERIVPHTFTGAPLLVRIRSDAGLWSGAGPDHVITGEVSWQTWAAGAVDLGTSCASLPPLAPLPWGEPDRGYSLAPWDAGTPALATILEGRGYGAGFWVASLQAARWPAGILGTTGGCDDLLADPVLVLPAGAPTLPGLWHLAVPAGPAGVPLFLQLVTVGNVGLQLRLGTSNAVRITL